MGLLAADLRALANLPVTPPGRRLLANLGTVLGMFAVLSWWVAQEVLDPARLPLWTAGIGSQDSLRAVLGNGLLPCPIVAAWLGLALAQRQLFESGELPLWRTAPLPPWRPAMQVLLRATTLVGCWAIAMSVPFTATVLQRADAPWTAWLLLPVALAVGTVPLLCTLLAVQIVLVRFFAGRWLRLLTTAVAAVASVGFTTWLLLGLFSPGGQRAQVLAAAAHGTVELPWNVQIGAALLAAAARGTLDLASLTAAGGWLAATLAMFWLAAWLHPRAVERQLLAEGPLRARRAGRWPASLPAAIRRKEIAQVLQQPGALVGFVLFGVVVFALAHKRVLIGPLLEMRGLPADLARFGGMAGLWFVAVLLVLYAHMGRVALWDGAQWPLYVASPARAGTILRGKLEAVALFLLWPLLLVALAGQQALGADGPTVVAFVGAALGASLAALGVLAAVGTWPRLMRPDTDGHIVQGSRSFVAALVLVLGFELAMLPAFVGWIELAHRAAREAAPAEAALPRWIPWILAVAWGTGIVFGGVGAAIGVRNYRRLLQPASPP